MAAIALQSAQLAKQQIGCLGVVYHQASSYSSDVTKINLAALKRGTGGRSSFNGVVATVFGCTGFVGRYVCNKLGKTGTQLILPYRGDHYDAIRLKVVGDLGQVLFAPFDLRDKVSIDKAVRYSNVVINLIGRDWTTKNFDFQDVHVKGAACIARACRQAGVEKLIHVSALSSEKNPEPIMLDGGSAFLASKYRGEEAVRQEFPDATIIRPSDIYGQEDRFLRYYSHIWRHQGRMMPLWRKGELTVKQPVFVSDVAQGIVNVIKDPDSKGKVYQFVGPKRYQLAELVDWFHRVMLKDKKWGYYRYDLRYDPLFKLRISLTEKISPNQPIGNLHWEKIERDHVTDKVLPGIPTLEDLDVKLMQMEDQVPWELKPFRAAAYYDRDLSEFEKPQPPLVCPY